MQIVKLYSFGIDLNITYSTKHSNMDNSGIFEFLKLIYFFYFLKHDGNDLKIDQWSLLQTSLFIAELKQKSIEY